MNVNINPIAHRCSVRSMNEPPQPRHMDPEFAREIERVREYVATLHAELPRWGLVVWTAGNVSQRVRGAAEDGSQDLLVIKPRAFPTTT